MNIIFGDSAKQLADKFTVLELDTIKLAGTDEKFRTYCVLESIPLTDFPKVESYVKLHNDMMQGYRTQQWNYCEDALKYLVGKWNGEVDSFYQVLKQRIQVLKESELPPDWDGTLERS
jgi:hypothetical protein